MRSLLIAIDGPAGAGKSSVAKALAQRFGLVLLDTGAIYRVLALAAERHGVSWDDADGLTQLASQLPIHFVAGEQTATQRVSLAGDDVTGEIRTSRIAQGASRVSTHAGVRQALLPLQRRLGASGCVAEGRDMGTVVFPDAPYKFFLTADLPTRAARRHHELMEAARAGGQKPEDVVPSLLELVRELATRDQRDSTRITAPLALAPDAVVVDTTSLELDQVVEHLVRAIEPQRLVP